MPRYAPPLVLTDPGTETTDRPCAGSPFHPAGQFCAPASFCSPPKIGRTERSPLNWKPPHTLWESGGGGMSASDWRGWKMRPRSGRPVSLATATVTKVLTTVTRPPNGTIPLECAQHGPQRRVVQESRAATLAGQRSQTAPGAHLQALRAIRSSRRSSGMSSGCICNPPQKALGAVLR